MLHQQGSPGQHAHAAIMHVRRLTMHAMQPPVRPQCDSNHQTHPPAGKEYAKADSRYASRDDFVISMEACTAFLEGPGCFLIVWAMLTRKAWRFSAITLVSLGQLYGDVLYFMTCIHGGGAQLYKHRLQLWHGRRLLCWAASWHA